MEECEACGKEVPYPFDCQYCGGIFCANHRLPETHSCSSMRKRQFGAQNGEIKESELNTERAAKEGKSHPRQEEKEIRVKGEQRKKSKKTVIFLCAMLIVLPIVAACGGYKFGYNKGGKIGFDYGYEMGYLDGNASGYQLAYNVAFLQGNLSGFELGHASGYQTGYAQGNSSGYLQGNNDGYQQGFNVGYLKGNSSGYTMGFADGNRTGYDDGYLKGVIDGAGRGYGVRDPTYQEALSFVASDETDKHKYSDPDYVCWNFAGDFKNNAFNAGFRCGWVYITLADAAHAIVCFNTTDRGLVFIEPQDDSVVTLTIGQPYWDREKYAPSYDDTVIRFGIIW